MHNMHNNNTETTTKWYLIVVLTQRYAHGEAIVQHDDAFVTGSSFEEIVARHQAEDASVTGVELLASNDTDAWKPDICELARLISRYKELLDDANEARKDLSHDLSFLRDMPDSCVYNDWYARCMADWAEADACKNMWEAALVCMSGYLANVCADYVL